MLISRSHARGIRIAQAKRLTRHYTIYNSLRSVHWDFLSLLWFYPVILLSSLHLTVDIPPELELHLWLFSMDIIDERYYSGRETLRILSKLKKNKWTTGIRPPKHKIIYCPTHSGYLLILDVRTPGTKASYPLWQAGRTPESYPMDTNA